MSARSTTPSTVSLPPPPPPPPALSSLSRRTSGGRGGGGRSALTAEQYALLDDPSTSDADFDAGALLNAALAGVPPAEEERRMAEVALQLQLETQDCHDEIGRVGAELQAVLPRCGADAVRLRTGLEGARSDAAVLARSFRSGGSGDTSSVLTTVHALRANLRAAARALEATASWDSDATSVPALLAEDGGRVEEAAAATERLRRGARALRGMPGREEREATLERFETRVDALLRPRLAHALANVDARIESLRRTHASYKQLGRADTFRREYVKNRPARSHKGWFGFAPSSNDDDDDGVDSFVAFLPKWYDSVLASLDEERERARTVFGVDRAPEVVVAILAESFRPLLPSFAARLGAVRRPDPAVSSDRDDAFPTVCAAYRATTTFLAAASLVADDADPAALEAAASSAASPFAAYQKRFAEFEGECARRRATGIARTVRAAVREASETSGRSSGKGSDDDHDHNDDDERRLSTLRDSIERLEKAAPLVFPLAEGALSRYESLTRGHDVSAFLSVVDSVLAEHASELTVAVDTLSASVLATDDHSDERLAQCALEVLKVAGAHKRASREFEAEATVRLDVLRRRLREEVENRGGSSSSTPLDRVECRLADAACANGDARAALGRLDRVLKPKGGRRGVALLPDARRDVARLARACRALVLDACLAAPRRHLDGVPSLPTWRADDDDEATDALPRPYATRVGEHLLALVQALEPFASDPAALAEANEVVAAKNDDDDGEPPLREAARPFWEALAETAASGDGGPAVASTAVTALSDGREERVERLLAEEDGGATTASDDDHHHDDEPLDGDDAAAAAFCNEWLDVVGSAVTARLLERVLRVPRLSASGTKRLAADLGYLGNVLSALGVEGHPHPLLGHVERALAWDERTTREKLAASRARTDEDAVDAEVRRVVRGVRERVASMRGLSSR